MTKTLLTLILLCGAAHAQPGVSMLIASKAASGSAPTLIAHTCQNLGTNGGTTATPIVTTGADYVHLAVVYGGTGLSGAVTLSISDSKSNGTPTQVPSSPYVGTVSAIATYYWANPTVGSAHTFTVTSAQNADLSVCVEAWSNMLTSGVLDASTDVGTNTDNGACQAASITPSAGVKVVISSLEFNGPSSVSIDSSFTLDDSVVSAGAGGWGAAIAHVIQTPNGATTQPTWTATVGGTSNITACANSAWKGM